ncbi:protein EARLY FLOWERING 3 isoform X1 [Panicum miliaceum]|uniref:Protein EARLY FLOWERING 3 isoform X1 n=1 Tax=Panicum miliaceum TaxID=4540 RepID=A0A3L6SRM1_PANMI|nr:protein EARLY FLOWERING 3 isoform X1 [Panicum miliaceum]
MTRGGAGGGGGREEQGKVMGPLFPRLHVNDAGRGGGPRAPPRNKMALYEQFTVPSSRFSSSAASTRAAGGSLVPSTSASQVYSYDRPLFQPFDAPSNEPARSSEKFKGNSISGQSNSTRRESGRMSSQIKNNDVCASKSIAECTSQHRVGNVIKNSSVKKVANNDEFMVPSICSPIFSQCSTQRNAGVQDKSRPLPATNPHKNPSMPKSYAECYSAVNRHLERIDESDMRSMGYPKAKEKEPVEGSKNVEVQEKSSSVQASKDKFKNKDAKTCQMGNNASHTNSYDNPHLGNSGRQPARMNGSSIAAKKSATRNTVPCKPCTDLNNSNQNSSLLERSLREAGAKRKRGHHDVEQNDDLSDDSVECMPSWEVSPDEIVGAIGPKHFWKARRAIQNQQRVFAVQVFELHKLIKVQKLIAASPHLLIEGDPILGSALVGKKNQLPKGNLKVQAVSIANKDDIQLTLEQPELSKQNTDANPPSPSPDDGLGGNCQDQAAIDETFTRNPLAMPAAPDNKQNNWCTNPPQNQWLVPVMSPSEGLVYKPYAGPCPPVGSLLTPFYTNCTPLRLPSTPYGVPMPQQPQHMAPPGAPTMHTNYFPPFSMPAMNPGAPASAVEQGRHPAAPQPHGRMEQQSLISCNTSHPSGIWRFHASRDSEPQASSASSPFDKIQVQADGSGPVSVFPTAPASNAQPQPSSGSRDQQNIVIRVVPHNAQTASESAARIFQSIQMERQQNDL